jgi:uncharacterized membrane protein YvlD (DUF360 family)
VTGEHPVTPAAPYGEEVSWRPATPRLRPLRLLISWIVAAASIWVAAAVVPGVGLESTGAAFVGAALIAVLNALLPPVLAALRLPFMLIAGFLLVLLADALLLLIAHELLPDDIRVDSFGDALLAALVMAAVSVVLQAILGTNDDDEYSLKVTRRIARRQGAQERSDVPGIIFLEIDGLALPVLRDALRDGSAPTMARWIADEGYRLAEWETDLSSQTGASQAGILLGSNEDITAFRWVEKERGLMMVCSSPSDCAEIERRRATGIGLLVDGGASRGNLLSGEAEETILTVSRSEAERRANPGYRAFLANGFNVTRAFVLFLWEIVLELTAAARAARRDVRPRGHRGGVYPLMRGAMCVIVRDLIVFGVLTDMMRGRPAVYATFSSYDEVAHHSGLERADTMEALRKLDQQFGRIARARPYAPRLRARRARRALSVARARLRLRRRRRAERHGPARGQRGDGNEGEAAAEERRLRARRRRPGLRQPRARLPDGDRSPAHRRGDRRAPSRPHPRPARAPAYRLAARPLGRARRGRPRAGRRQLPRRGPGRGRRSPRRLLAHRGPPPAAHRRLRARRRHHGRQLL